MIETSRKLRPEGTARAIGRSLRIYHGDPVHRQALDALHARFVAPGDLVFDIGAHVGDRISSFRRLGARVVALEPQPGARRALRLIHGRDRNVTLLQAAAGEQSGDITLLVNTKNPTVSTASQDFIAAARGAAGWEGQSWDHRITVPALTLDSLVAAYGVPDFVKIDVEGFEDRVLAGLSRPVKLLSFEFTTIQRDIARKCLVRLASLGDYRFGMTLGESQRFVCGEWVAADEMARSIDDLPHEANSGDVYARLQV
jgi:FkbM family methyltransferase